MSSALVCLSGGVDSTAALLRCTLKFSAIRGVYVDMHGTGPPREAVDCCEKLGIGLLVIPAEEQFRNCVKKPSYEMLRNGLTPNPCAMCNAGVKLALPFGILQPGETLVTGHYAGFTRGLLSRGYDDRKDQSYFLSLVPMEILSRCYFPLADSLKSDVWEEVRFSGLPHVRGESQDLCFTLSGSGIPGDIVDMDGNVAGSHSGLEEYTPGQRKGIGAHGERKYVVRVDMRLNRVVIGDLSDLYSMKCTLNSINWLQEPDADVFDCDVQTRYRKPAAAAEVCVSKDTAEIRFKKPQKAVSPGQVGVLYRNDAIVLGGGTIA